MDFNKEKKSYSKILSQLTKEQITNFDTGGCFLFGDRKPSISTIYNYDDDNDDRTNMIFTPKINVKELLKMQEQNNELEKS